MKRLLVPAAATGRTIPVAGIVCSLILLAVAVLGVLVGCAGEERLSREEFSERLQSIDRRGSERWGRLAEQARDLEPDQPLPADVKQPMRELIEFQRDAAGELEKLNPPQGAEDEVETLVEALRERTETFEQAMVAGRFTQRESDQVTRSGDRINAAFEQLRTQGFLPTVEEHE